jgi:molybdate/tungstate transport system substrate-binding protein
MALLHATGCGPGERTPLKVFHAGSLTVPFERLERAFEGDNPRVDVQREAYGSAAAIRQVTELGRPADVLASADAGLIDRLMIEADRKAAAWNVLFARNTMCLAYRDAERAVTPADWGAKLMDARTRVGMSDPNRDPCGYRSLACVYLADTVLGKDGLFGALVGANSGVTIRRDGPAAQIRVPSDVAYNGRLFLRPKEVDLLALLETGVIDYLFIYRSVAVQHGLPYLALPDQINLGQPELAELYGRVTVVQFADRPERTVAVAASPIVYGLTVPLSARRPALALKFVRLVLSERGRAILGECGQPALSPAAFSTASDAEATPLDLQ